MQVAPLKGSTCCCCDIASRSFRTKGCRKAAGEGSGRLGQEPEDRKEAGLKSFPSWGLPLLHFHLAFPFEGLSHCLWLKLSLAEGRRDEIPLRVSDPKYYEGSKNEQCPLPTLLSVVAFTALGSGGQGQGRVEVEGFLPPNANSLLCWSHDLGLLSNRRPGREENSISWTPETSPSSSYPSPGQEHSLTSTHGAV